MKPIMIDGRRCVAACFLCLVMSVACAAKDGRAVRLAIRDQTRPTTAADGFSDLLLNAFSRRNDIELARGSGVSP